VQEPQEIFYKDEGGKANHLVAVVAVTGGSMNNRRVTLTPKLCYENGREVEDALDIFKVVSVEPPNVSTANENMVVKFRIEKVSRRKDGQRFKLRMDIDEAESTADIRGSVFTSAVCVLSKRKFTGGQVSPPNKRAHTGAPTGNEMKKMKINTFNKYGNVRRPSNGLEDHIPNTILLSLHKTIARLEAKVGALTDKVASLESEVISSRNIEKLEYPLFNRVRGDSEETEFLYNFVGFEDTQTLKRESTNEICMNFGIPSSIE